MSSIYGDKIKISIFGQSHGEGIGVVMDGLPAGEKIDTERLNAFLARRAPGKSEYSTPRKEEDAPRFLSGLVDGVTCGAPLCAVIENRDTRSGDYEKLRDVPRPGHADYPAYIKHGGHSDPRGGGHFSARLTAPMCVAGGILIQLLERRGVYIGGHIWEIASRGDAPFDPVNVSPDILRAIAEKDFPVLDDAAGAEMREKILEARSAGDSVGGAVECAVIGLPPGTGEPIFNGLENEIARAVFGVPAVKGIEFGAGFAASRMRGSENNDPFIIRGGKITAESNNHGGILGGLASGMPILFRAAFKPTSSISIPQRSVSMSRMVEEELKVVGRHDPCVVPRAVPCVEAAAAMAVAQFIL